MSAIACDLAGAELLLPGQGLAAATLSIADGRIVDAPVGRVVDLAGFTVLPGIVDLHGDGFERHVAPRRGAMTRIADGLSAAADEMAVNGITTGVLAQFHSWEGGLRGPEFAARLFDALAHVRPQLVPDLRPQLRFETHMLDDYAALPVRLADWGVSYVVFNDHLPHDRLDAGKLPRRLTGQALKSGRSPERHLQLIEALHARRAEVPAALDGLCAALAGQGLRMGSHDDRRAADRVGWAARGVTIAEFPETEEAARAARETGGGIVLGAPNVLRGGSHNGNVSARDLVAAGLCDALASDYLYPAPRLAALALAGTAGFETAWGLVSDGPARLLGLGDRGRLEPGLRADLLILDRATGRVGATICAGRVAHMSGPVAERFIAAATG